MEDNINRTTLQLSGKSAEHIPLCEAVGLIRKQVGNNELAVMILIGGKHIEVATNGDPDIPVELCEGLAQALFHATLKFLDDAGCVEP